MRWFWAVLAIGVSSVAAAFELDERPAEPGDWGYRPAHDAVVDRNPPGFTWRPTADAETYDFEVAGDAADFEDPVYRVDAHRWSAHCPPELLGAGDYYWRYRATDAEGAITGWSQTRRFTVPDDAAHFPMPTPATQAERAPDGHPRLFMRPETLPELQQLAEGPLADRFDSLLDSAEQRLDNMPDTSEPPLYPDGVERLSEEWREIWWGNRRHTIAVVDRAAKLGFVYRLTGDTRFADAGRDLLMALTGWDPEGSTSYSYNDEAAMPILYMASRAYTWLHDHLSEEERKAVVEMMRIRGEECFNHLGRHLWQPYGSHRGRAWHFLGELAIAFYDDIPEAEKWLDFAMTVFYTAYPAWGGADGGWHEGTIYWRSYLNRFLFWADVMDAAFDIDIYDRPFFSQTGYYLMCAAPPGSRHGGFGNQTPDRNTAMFGELMLLLAVGAENPHWKWYADAVGGELGGGYLGFLRAAKLDGIDLEPQPPVTLPSSRKFADVGLAFLNTNLLDAEDNVQIHFKSSPYGTRSHGYNANNAFLLHLRGEQVLRRSGRRDIHGSPHHREWMWHTKSDNAITVNGEGQRKGDGSAQGQITHFHTSDHLDVVAGEAGTAYDNLDRWTRRIVFLKPHTFVIHDVVEAPEPSRYQWMLHAPDEFDIGDSQVQWAGEPGALDIRFLAPGQLDISQTDEYDTPPHDWASWDQEEWHLTVETVEDHDATEYLTVFFVDGVEPEIEYEQSAGHRVALSYPGEEEAVLRFGNRRFGVEWKGVAESFTDDDED